jgi:hypothetical protein
MTTGDLLYRPTKIYIWCKQVVAYTVSFGGLTPRLARQRSVAKWKNWASRGPCYLIERHLVKLRSRPLASSLPSPDYLGRLRSITFLTNLKTTAERINARWLSSSRTRSHSGRLPQRVSQSQRKGSDGDEQEPISFTDKRHTLASHITLHTRTRLPIGPSNKPEDHCHISTQYET